MGEDIFETTCWSVVLKAGRADTPVAAAALSELCQTYWYPLYAYLRRRGYGPHDAEDLTQGFFAKLLRLRSIGTVSPEQGKFRAFLLAAMKHFLSEERRRAQAQRRDARRTVPLAIDRGEAEARYALEPADPLTPEVLFERGWALTLLDRVMRRLADDFESAGRGALFRALRFSIAGDRSALPYRELAGRLGMSEGAVRVAVHRLRQDYRRVLRDEIAQTVAGAEEVEEELRDLRRILAAGGAE